MKEEFKPVRILNIKPGVKLIIPSNATDEEIVDMIADVFEVTGELEAALGDGFQVTDLFALLGQEKQVREIVNDFPLFLKQLGELKPDRAVSLVLEAKSRVELKRPLGRIGKFAFGALFNLADDFQFVFEVRTKAEKRIENWRTLLAGGDPFPQLQR